MKLKSESKNHWRLSGSYGKECEQNGEPHPMIPRKKIKDTSNEYPNLSYICVMPSCHVTFNQFHWQ